MDQTEIAMGQKALGLLRRVHERGLVAANSPLAREIADLLGQPGDPEVRRVEKATMRWDTLGPGYTVMRVAVRNEAKRLSDLANAIGAGSSSQKALTDLKALADQVENI